ncbi:MAG TPA: YciI family protein [Gemmatimonadales bacterium]|nr:YciI family protein [Gemmatimonadales bacterium]
MRFMTMVKAAETSTPPPRALMDAIDRLGQEAAKEGVIVQMGGLYPSAAGARMRLSKGKIVVTDGPFTEAKEVIGGFAVYDVPSKEEALAWTRRFLELHERHWKGWEGEVEIRRLFDGQP